MHHIQVEIQVLYLKPRFPESADVENSQYISSDQKATFMQWFLEPTIVLKVNQIFTL